MAEESKINIEKLNGSNYQTWKFNAKLVLMNKGLWSIVNGTEKAPVTTDADKKEKEVKEFVARSDKAYSIIALALNKSLQVHIANTVDPKAAWDTLEKHFNFVSITQKVRVTRQFYAASMSEGSNLMDHITHMTGLSERLREMGEQVDDKKFATVLLGTLPESYDVFLTSMNARSADDLSWDDIKPALMEEFIKRKDKDDKKKD